MRNLQVPDRIRATVICLSLILLSWAVYARAGDAIAPGGGTDNLSRGLVGGLSKRYPGARIEISPSIRWVRGQPPDTIDSVELFEDNSRGEVRLRVDGESFDPETQANHVSSAEGIATFSAYVRAWVANRRIFPGEKLDAQAFGAQEVNVASGPYRDIRGLIIPAKTDLGAAGTEPVGDDSSLTSLQTRQSVLEGGLLLSSAVERIPDVRRGDAVRINVVASGLVLTVSGIAEEPAYLSGRVRVMTDRSKRELVGQLGPGGIVEVHL